MVSPGAEATASAATGGSSDVAQGSACAFTIYDADDATWLSPAHYGSTDVQGIADSGDAAAGRACVDTSDLARGEHPGAEAVASAAPGNIGGGPLEQPPALQAPQVLAPQVVLRRILSLKTSQKLLSFWLMEPTGTLVTKR